MHHPYGWLEPVNARALRAAIETASDVVLTGHEHNYERLTEDGLQVTLDVTNAGETDLPFGYGAHPYLTVGASRRPNRPASARSPSTGTRARR